MLRRHLLVVASSLLLAAPLTAQPATIPDVAAAPTAGALQAARELMQVMNMERVMLAGMEASVESQVQAVPQMEPFRDVMLTWARKHLTWEKAGPRMIELYAREFTEAELREMSAFYGTATGRKTIERMPELMRRGSEIGMQLAAEHQGELQQMIEARAAELQKAGTPPPPAR